MLLAEVLRVEAPAKIFVHIGPSKRFIFPAGVSKACLLGVRYLNSGELITMGHTRHSIQLIYIVMLCI